jgi:hypothetical protein
MYKTPSPEEYKAPDLTEQARHLIDSDSHFGAPTFGSHNTTHEHNIPLKLLGFKEKIATSQILPEAEQEVVNLINNGLSRWVDVHVDANTWSGSMLIVEMADADSMNPPPQDCLYFVRIMQGDDEGEIWLTNPYTKDFRGYELEHFIFSADRGLIEYAVTESQKRLIERYKRNTEGYHFTEDPNKRLQTYLFEKHDPDYPYELSPQ